MTSGIGQFVCYILWNALYLLRRTCGLACVLERRWKQCSQQPGDRSRQLCRPLSQCGVPLPSSFVGRAWPRRSYLSVGFPLRGLSRGLCPVVPPARSASARRRSGSGPPPGTTAREQLPRPSPVKRPLHERSCAREEGRCEAASPGAPGERSDRELHRDRALRW